ncbi:efflux RND transporter permease subunit [Fibrobacterota bacterium]
MNITETAIKRNRLSIGILLAIFLMGFSVFNQMPRDDMPPFTFRVASIVTLFPGGTPERVEMLISDRIEKVIQELPEVANITSESRTGVSVVVVEIKESETEMRPIWDKIRRKMRDIKNSLPDGIQGPTVNDELADVFGILVGITGEGYTFAELKEVADDVRDELIKLPNSAKVEIAGAQEEQIFIDYDNARLAELGLTKQHLQQTLAGTNIIFPGGDISIGNERIMLEPTGNFESLEDLKRTIVKSTDGSQIVYLGDVATIYRGYKEPQTHVVKINGERGIVLGVSVKEGGNIMNLGTEVDEKMDELREIYPIGIEFQRVASQDISVNDSVNDFISNVMQSVGVVMVVMLLFLGFRTGMIVASLIPSAIIMTIFVLARIDVGLNMVSLGSLIIALGMLVDNAIVVSESVMVKIENGQTHLNAALESARELYLPLLVASLTTCAAFLSFFLAESVMGEIVGQIFIVVSIALLSSWILSLTIIPMLCMRFIKIKKTKTGENRKATVFDRMMVYYKKLLTGSLKRPVRVITAIIVVFLIAMWSFSLIPFLFLFHSDRPIVTANIELPLGTRIETTEEVIDDIERFIRDSIQVSETREEGVLSWSSYIGEGAPKYDMGYFAPESSPNSAHLLLNTTSDEANQGIIDKLDEYFFEQYPEMNSQVGRLGSGGAGAYPIAIRITGKNLEKLFDLADQVKAKVSGIPGTKNVIDDWGMRTKKLIVKINPTKARLAGVTNYDIAVSLSTNLTGAVTGEFREDDKAVPIIMRNAQTGPQNIGKLESMNIYSQATGKNVPLKQVADIEVDWQYSKILRRNQYRTVTVLAGIRSGYNAAKITGEIMPWLEQEQTGWPTGYTFGLGGEAEESSEGMSSVSKNLPLSLFIIVLLLVGQFNSVRKSVIVLSTIPLGLIGVAFGLLITQSYFGFMAFLGIISLSGIVINNAIVLLDRIRIELDEFKSPPQKAIVEAALKRFRPIMLTTFTTSLGLIPLWLGGGIMWEPMAIGILFGLLFATVITLVFVPVLYKVLFRVSFKGYAV